MNNACVSEDWAASAKAWIDFVGQDANRSHLLDPVMLDLAGDAQGKLVCDIGCGEGRFVRQLAARGAKVVGLDPTVALLSHAASQDGKSNFLRAKGETLPLKSHTFDLAVSYVALIDVADFRTAIKEMARILKPGGRLLIANLNPFATTSPRAWRTDDEGNHLFVAVDNYFEEQAQNVSWAGIEVINWHRPMAAYFEALLDSGLILRKYLEPRPTPQALQERPKLEYGDRVPFFHVMLWEKPR